jgi:hypothetical protein
MGELSLPQEVLRFITEHVDSVPHLETLLLLRETAPRPWTVEEIARRVYLPRERVEAVLRDLVTRQWLEPLADAFVFSTHPPDATVIGQVAAAYRHNLVRVAEAIHRKAPAPVLDFARAFQLRKEP